MRGTEDEESITEQLGWGRQLQGFPYIVKGAGAKSCVGRISLRAWPWEPKDRGYSYELLL